MPFYNHGKFSFIILPIIIWVLFWKGYALWTSAKNGDKKWFIALMVLNTLGILEIIYIFSIANKKWSDIKDSVNRLFK